MIQINSLFDLATIVRRRRLEIGLTSEELAESLGIQVDAVVGLESSSGAVDISTALVVLRRLGVSLYAVTPEDGDGFFGLIADGFM
ncbi:Helix-turn-helix [Micrococcales bacterium KH10]|nr:Helix-turn-helix [Micrococcales bacterium KH10]